MTALLPGHYICVRTSGFVPWVIREATDSEVNHTAIVLPRQRVAEAGPGGVIVSPLAKYTGAYAVSNVNEPMTGAQRERVWRKAESLVGTPYDFAAIGEDACDILHWHWTWLLRLAGARRRLDCSQMAAVCGAAAVPPLDWLCGKATYCEVTPGDLARRPGVVQVTI